MDSLSPRSTIEICARRLSGAKNEEFMNIRERSRGRIALVSAAAAVGIAPAAFGLLAFPGADGFGANALGGRGGAVYHVTNLTDNTTTPAAGSFRAVLAQIATDEKRTTNPVTAATVVFDVGGTITLTSNLDVKNVNNVTIAGQTAPGPGINMVGYKFDVTSSNGTKATDATSNIIIRYLADRRGNTISSTNDDAMGVLGSTSDMNHNTHDVIMDHVTASWGMDEDLSVTDSATNVTVQNSFITEALESGHQFGSLIRPRYGASVSYVGNLYANNQSRNPRPGSYNNSLLNFDFRDNTIYNYGDRAGYTGGATDVNTEYVNMNYTGNYVIAGPSTPTDFRQTTAFLVDTSQGVKDPLVIQVYQANNLVDSNRNSVPDGTNIGWSAFAQSNGVTTAAFNANQSSILTTTEESSPFAYSVPGTATTDPTIAYEQTLANAGNTPWARNASDARVVADVQSNQGAILQTAPTAEYNALIAQAQVNRPAGFDTDGDGMPNSWEAARGLNSSNAADGNTVVTSAESPTMAGYTWLEMYLNDLTLQANYAGGTHGSWDNILAWNGQLPNLQDSTANFSDMGAPAVVTTAADEHVGQLAFSSANGYTVNGTGDISMDVLSHNNGGYATVTVSTGSDTIAVPLNLDSATQFTIAGGSLLDVTGTLSAAGQAISMNGGGNIRFGNVRAASLSINSGNVLIRQGATHNSAGGISVIGSLGVASSSYIDITNNAMILPYSTGNGTASVTAVRTMLQGGQLISSSADAGYRLAYGDNASLGITNLGGLNPGTNSVVIEFLPAGDTDFSNSVGENDFLTFEANYGKTSGGTWATGDFDYNGTVDANDFRLFVAGLEESGGTPTADMIAFGNSIGVPVPEPTALSVIGLGACGLLKRRRRQAQR
jgi:hypothetical protein